MEHCSRRDGDRAELQGLRRLGDNPQQEKEIDSLTIMPSKAVDWESGDVLYLKEEPIYLKKDVVELHTVERWYKELRQVRED